MARIYSGIGMRGKVPDLHFVIKIGDRQVPPPHPEHWKFHKEYLDVVLAGLKAVVAGGTGGATRLQNVEVAGKTGSAEAPPEGSKTHAWFACYAPADNPRIAICAFVEHGGHGGTACAPIAKVMLEKFFALEPPKGEDAASIGQKKPAKQAKALKKKKHA
jgi:cell division protein FtsI/penicillin-binding protein 2